ncbi:MAG: CopD family protein [Thioalkalivibrionaceae bacterium]
MNPLDALVLTASAALWMTALLVAGSALVAWALPKLAPAATRVLMRQAIGAGLLGIVAVVVFVLVQAMMLGGGVGWPDPFLLDMILDSPQGQRAAWIVAGVVLVLAAMVALARQGCGSAPDPGPASRDERLSSRDTASGHATVGQPGDPLAVDPAQPRCDRSAAIRLWRVALAAAGAMLIHVGFTQTGHTVREPRVLLALILWGHLAAVAFWLASLWPLHQAVRVVPPDVPSLQRFGRIATVVVTWLVLAGGALVVWLSNEGLMAVASDPRALWAVEWLRWLTLKLILVAVLLGLAAVNRWWWVPRLAAADALHDDGVASPSHGPGRTAQRALRASITLEFILFLLILFTTAAMLTHPPMGKV